MNKKLIRLTESDLHRIVKESVNKILSETINELDPRTYASYADKRRAQGQNDKAFRGTQAAVNAWNKEYSNDYIGDDIPDDRDTVFMTDYDLKNADGSPYDPDEDRRQYDNDVDTNRLYTVNRQYEHPGVGFDAEYDPNSDTSKGFRTDGDGYDTFMGMINAKRVPGDEKLTAFPGKVNSNGLDVAKQMARGNGKYIKGKGWQ